MRVGIDAHAIGTAIGGNETFMHQLFHGLRAVAPDAGIVALVNRSMLGKPEAVAGFPAYPIPTDSSWIRVPFALPYLVRKHRLDLLHVQYNAPPYCPCPFVVILHDVVWLRYPETLPVVDRVRMRLATPNTLRRARRVFCVTEAIRQETAAVYNLPLSTIDVVPNAIDPMFRRVEDPAALDAVRAKYRLPRDFVLYVGALQPRKNLVRLAQAYRRLRDRGFPHALVLAGRRTYYGPMAKELEALRLGERLIFTGYVAPDDLPPLMSAAAAFAYVSLYEGFGIPVVEALACGTPVLASTDPALTEVAGGLAIHSDPRDVDAIEDGLVRVLADDGVRERARKEGPGRAAFYSRERMGKAALAGYRRALGLGGD